jgi:hypothetical protein
MAFLNNSGDIIVDAVLTDVGRQKLAQGNGNFRISIFALGDAEIDYGLYNSTNPSGSAYYDLNILQTPIFEPSTYAASDLTSKLITLTDNNLLYLPVLKLNQSQNTQATPVSYLDTSTNAFDLIANDNFANFISSYLTPSILDGRINLPANSVNQTSALATGVALRSAEISNRLVKVSQGFDNPLTNVSLKNNGTNTNPDLEETSFSIYVNRLFLSVADKNLQVSSRPVFSTNVFNRTQTADVYKVDLFNNQSFFGSPETYNDGNVTKIASSLNASNIDQVGRELQFSLKISNILASNPSYYFTTFGSLLPNSSVVSGKTINSSDTVYMISTTVRIVGNTYGYSVDVPVKLFYKA